MAEYIEVDLLRDEILYAPDYDGDTVNHFLSIVDSQPTADVVEVKHGYWKMRGGRFRCSVCDEKALTRDAGGTGGFSSEYEQVKSTYCPNCGAKMDLKEGG